MTTLAIGTLLLVGTARPARASNCTLFSQRYFALETQLALNEYGIKASNILVTGLEPCVQSRTLYVEENADNYVEVGWYRDGTDQSLSVCTNSTAARILVYQVRGGGISCKPNTAILTNGENYSFKVENLDHNNSFNYFYGAGTIPTIALGSYMTNHNNGMAVVSDESHQAGDNLRAHFTGVNSLGSSVWHGLPAPFLTDGPGNEDPFIVCSRSSTSLHVEVPASC